MSSRRLRSNLSGQKVGQSGHLARRFDHDGLLDQPSPHTYATAAAASSLVLAPGTVALSFSDPSH
jgi:hypothetical protein